MHLGPATRLVRLAKESKSAIWLEVGDKVANARSILAVLLLCAVSGVVVSLEIDGDDEDEVLKSVAGIFEPERNGGQPRSV